MHHVIAVTLHIRIYMGRGACGLCATLRTAGVRGRRYGTADNAVMCQ